MAIDLQFQPNPIHEREPLLARAFEEAVRGALEDAPALAPAPLRVRFAVWEGDEVRYVCKVEAASAASLEPGPPAWRFWSGLVATPEELGEQIADAVRARTSPRPAPARAARAALQEHWGWAEMRPV